MLTRRQSYENPKEEHPDNENSKGKVPKVRGACEDSQVREQVLLTCMLEEQTKPVSVEHHNEAESTSDSGVLVVINDQLS